MATSVSSSEILSFLLVITYVIFWMISVRGEKSSDEIFRQIAQKYSLNLSIVEFPFFKFLAPYGELLVRQMSGSVNGKTVVVEDIFKSGSYYPCMYVFRNNLLFFTPHRTETRISIQNGPPTVLNTGSFLHRIPSLDDVDSAIVSGTK